MTTKKKSTKTEDTLNTPMITAALEPDELKSLDSILERLKKRQLDAKEEPTAKKPAYTGMKRIDLNATVVAVRNGEKSERFTVVLVSTDLQKLDYDEQYNGYFDQDENKIKLKLKDAHTYDTSLSPGEIVEFSRYHGGIPEKVPRTYEYGDSVVLKRVSCSTGKNADGKVFLNTHWVEHSTQQFEVAIPKSMTNLLSEGYYKALTFPQEDPPSIQDLRVTSSNKIYTRMTLQQKEMPVEAMLWQEKLHRFGIANPEVIEKILPQAFSDTTITLFGNKEKSADGYDNNTFKFSVRRLILGKTNKLTDYVVENAQSLEKADVIKELGKLVASPLNTNHPLNSIEKTKLLNLSEWEGSISNLGTSTKFYKLFSVIFAVLA